MQRFFKKLKEDYRFKKNDSFLIGAYLGLWALCLFILAMGGYFFRTGLSPWLQVFVYVLIGLVAFYAFRWIGALVHAIFTRISGRFVMLILATVATFWLATEIRFSWPGAVFLKSMVLAMTSAILIGSGLFSAFRHRTGKGLYLSFAIIGMACAYFSLRPILQSGEDPFPFEPKDYYPSDRQSFALPDPSQKGSQEVRYFTYGSGNDIRREEFGADVTYTTEAVNALPLLPEWKGKRKKWRERYWGFGIENAPINGRVWMPAEGDQLPLVLIVHGNHGMEHHSDPGYAYLGELLASRGFITVSVDENFINGTWSGDFRGKEMPARAWLLLKHLDQWKAWAQDEESPLFQKADTDNVILIGHSRGGEAVSIAAAYNQLSHFPDDASVAFDFNYGIKGLVAIAPTDARYFRRIELQDISYLSLQGTYDADEASFFGLRQYQRVSLPDSSQHFKAGVLIHKANHGQFNSIWGRRDFGEPSGWFLNTGALIQGEEQRQTAKVFISAFAERLFNQQAYDPIFEQPYLVSDWLPETVLLGNYQRPNTDYLLDFESDLDLVNDQHVSINASNFLVWREEALTMRDGGNQGTNAVILGWDADSLGTPTYELILKDSILLSDVESLTFSIGRTDASDLKLEGDEPIDFSVSLVSDQDTMTLPTLSTVIKPAPLLKVKYMKLKQMNGSFGDEWELNMETAAIPLQIPQEKEVWLKKLQFVFDQSTKGIIALDNIGLRKTILSEEKQPD